MTRKRRLAARTELHRRTLQALKSGQIHFLPPTFRFVRTQLLVK